MTRIKLWLAAAGAAVLAVFGVYLAGRRDGGDAAEAKETRRRLDAVKEAHEVQDEVRRLEDDAVRDALTRWMRDP